MRWGYSNFSLAQQLDKTGQRRRSTKCGAVQQVGVECFSQIHLPLFLTHLCVDDRCLHRKKTPRVMTKRLGAPSRAPSLVYPFSTPLDVVVLTKCLCPPRHLNRWCLTFFRRNHSNSLFKPSLCSGGYPFKPYSNFFLSLLIRSKASHRLNLTNDYN